jgi:DNA replication licensing factor MCM7
MIAQGLMRADQEQTGAKSAKLGIPPELER